MVRDLSKEPEASYNTEAAHRCLGAFPMSSTHHAHAYLRPSPPAGKKPSVKGPRSALSSRTTASHKLAVRGGNKSKVKLEKEKERGKQSKDVEEEDDELGEGDKEEMGTSFLQYW